MRFVTVRGDDLGEAAIRVIKRTAWLGCATAVVPSELDLQLDDVCFRTSSEIVPESGREMPNRHHNIPGPWLSEDPGAAAQMGVKRLILVNGNKGVNPLRHSEGLAQAVIIRVQNITGKKRRSALSTATPWTSRRRQRMFI